MWFTPTNQLWKLHHRLYGRFSSNLRSKTGFYHSRPQRPRSFWSAPRIATSGQVQRHSGFEWICKHNRLRPEPIRFVRLDSDRAQSDGKSDIPVLNGFVNTIVWDQSQSDLSDLTLIVRRVTGSPWIADFHCWTWLEVAILGADQKERGLWGREWVFTTFDENWIAHALYLSAGWCDAMYYVRGKQRVN